MSTRRAFLRSLSLSPLTLPFIGRTDHAAARQSGAGLPAPGDPAYWDKLRDQFLLANDKTFFNTGTFGAMPRVVVEAVIDHLRQTAVDLADWDYRGADWIAGYQPLLEVRARIARLVNADVKEVALTENVTSAMSYVAAGLDLEPGDEVLTSDQEHPGGRSAWELRASRSKTRLRTVPIPKPAHGPDEIIEIFRKAFAPETRVIVLQHIVTGSGAILPVKEICAEARSKGIFTVVDGAQAPGHIRVDVKDLACDAYVACFHKWVLAPAGTGFMCVRGEKMKDIWATLASGQWDNHEDEGFRFTQRGTNNLSLIRGLEAALDFHFQIGPDRVYDRIKFLGDRLRDGLRRIPKARIFSPEDPAMCAGITVWNIDGCTGAKIQDEMWARERLRPRAQSDQYGVRQSTHIYNSVDEIDRSLKVARALAGA